MISSIATIILEPRVKQLIWLIKIFEGFNASVYKDSAGHSTIGYGHEIIGSLNQDEGLKYLNLPLSQIEKGLSESLASQLLGHDILNRIDTTITSFKNISDSVWVALTSFCFNIGTHNFRKSEAFKYLPSFNLYKIADSLSSWRECNKVFSQGIAKRRFIEVLILLQKSIDPSSSLLPSQQWGSPCPLPFTDENWVRLSPQLKNDIDKIYTLYTKNFPK